MASEWAAAPPFYPHWYQTQQYHYYQSLPGSAMQTSSLPPQRLDLASTQMYPQSRPNAQLNPLSTQEPCDANEVRVRVREVSVEAEVHTNQLDNHPMFLDSKRFKELQSSAALTEYRILPQAARVIYTSSHTEADRLLHVMLASFDWQCSQHINPDARWGQPRIVGLDAEWRGHPRTPEAPVALVQISSKRTVLLLHLHKMTAFPTNLSVLLQDPRILKVGVGIEHDAKRLRRSFPCANIVVTSCIELSKLARAVDGSLWPGRSKEMISLQRLVHAYHGTLLPKGDVRTSNWEGDLDAEQISYAAKDAHASFVVGHTLFYRAQEVAQSGDSEMVASRFGFDVLDSFCILEPSFSL